MKHIRTSSGVKRIDDSDPAITIAKLRELLSEHRAILISRLIGDLATYMDYRFALRPDARQLHAVKERLYSIKNAPLDLERYDPVFQQVLRNESTYVADKHFFMEIDDAIGRELNAAQMLLVP